MKLTYDKHVQGNGGTKVLVIGCVHGDELIGKKVISELRKLTVSHGTLITVLANTRAIKLRKRFIDQDLNRSFPGNMRGNHEEQLAYALALLLQEVDIVLDIHSTTTDTTSAIILTKINQSIRKLLSLFHPKRVLVMRKHIGENALIDYCKAGISFEYGKDQSKEAYITTLGDIKKILIGLGMVESKDHRIVEVTKTAYFEVFGVLERPEHFTLNKTIKNFLHIRKGQTIASSGRQVQKAPYSFYPVLFGQRAYKEIWGFMAKKVKEI